MDYKEELELLYLQLNKELIDKRSSRVYNIDKYKVALASLESQIKNVKAMLDTLNKQTNNGGKVNERLR